MSQTHIEHANDAADFIRNEERTHWHDQALWFVRVKRDKAAGAVPEWEQLRSLAAQIKEHTLSQLGEYLEQFEQQATQRGIQVHWARNAEEHNQIVFDILQQHQVGRIVKSKSMLTEECHLNPYLEERGIEVVDTDLGERIVQLRNEPPSHIVLPAIHIKKQEVGETFHKHLGTEEGATDPNYLTEAARGHLRSKFMAAEAGITGVNFAVAETGGFVVCTNEGNADIGISLPKLHIACMGIEKLIPRAADLSVFTRLLARNATGQPITTYTSHFHGPAPGGELHLVLVDNGRSALLGDEKYRDALRCIRCGACLNTCPVYRRSGGHSYHATIPGPIGSVLNATADAQAYHSLPYACSLCGSCADVCPVKIPLDQQLLDLRGEIARRKYLPLSKRLLMKMTSFVMQRTWLFAFSGKLARTFGPWMPRFLVYSRLNAWGRQREIPEFPKKVFANYTGSVMNSRQKILSDVRGTQIPETPLPDLEGDWITYPDPKAQFAQVLEAVGGRAMEIANADSIDAGLRQLDVYNEATRIWSHVPGVESIGGDWAHLSDPHEFESLECCVVPGEFAVAENGAVWLTHEAIPHRAALFITQHLVLVVSANCIVQNMHEAYSRISFEQAQFGIFISGPSKTADIEQSLVIGAHGARSLTVLLVNDSP